MPAMPMISEDFGATDLQVQLSFVLFVFGATFARLFWGALSDHLGRKKILLVTMMIQILAQFGCATSGNIESLILFRVIQSLGAGINTVIGTAIFADIFIGIKRAKYMGLLELTLPIGLSMGPIIGAYMLDYYGTWRVAFSFLATIFSALTLAIMFWITETLHEKSTDTFKQTAKHYHTMMQDHGFFTFSVLVSLLICSYLIFVINAPFIYMEYFKVSVVDYGYYQVTPMLANLVGMIIYKHAITKLGLEKCVKACLVALFGIIPLYFAVYFIQSMQTPVIVITIVSIQSVLAAFLIPGLVTMAMDLFPRNKGVAASILGCMRTLLASIGMVIVSYFFGTSLNVTMLSMGIVTIASCVLIFRNWKTFKHAPEHHE